MRNLLKFEPVALSEAIRTVLMAAVAFGLNWTGDQIAAFMIAVGAILALKTRSSVTPVPRYVAGPSEEDN